MVSLFRPLAIVLFRVAREETISTSSTPNSIKG